MEIRKISEDGKNIEIEIDVDLTILNSLIDELLKSENVEIAIIKSGHPLVDKKKIFVRTKKTKPIYEIKNAIKNIISKIDKFKIEFEKSIESLK